MFDKNADDRVHIDDAIRNVYREMESLTADSPEYAKMVDQLDKLYKIKDHMVKDRVGLKTWIPVIGSVGGILVIVVFEAFGHSVTSKALSFARKV